MSRRVEQLEEPGVPGSSLPYVVKVGVSGDEAEAEDLRSALGAAHALIDDALPGHGFDLRSCRLSVIVTNLGRYDGYATRLAQLGKLEPVALEGRSR